jgi:hypothetical protein
MLHNFIRSMISPSTNNPRLRTSLVVFDTNGIFAHIFEPDVFECAVAITVNTFSLVFTNDGIFKSRAGLEEEYCVSFAWVSCVVRYVRLWRWRWWSRVESYSEVVEVGDG